APRAGGAERLHIRESEGLCGKPTGGLASHACQTALEAIQCRFFTGSDTAWPLRDRPAECSRAKRHSFAEWGWAHGDWLTACRLARTRQAEWPYRATATCGADERDHGTDQGKVTRC